MGKLVSRFFVFMDLLFQVKLLCHVFELLANQDLALIVTFLSLFQILIKPLETLLD